MRELTEPRGAGARVSLSALELPREQHGAHPASMCCVRAVGQLPAPGRGVSSYPCFCLPHSLQVLEQTPSTLWKGGVRVRGWLKAREVLLRGYLPTLLHCFSQKRRKDGPKEPAKGAMCWENGKEKAASAELAPEEPRAEVADPPRPRREPSNPKRTPGRSEALGGKSPASPGTQSGPSAKRAVYLKVAPAEEELNARVTGSMEPSKGHSGRAGSRRNGRASQVDAPTALADLAPPLEKVPEHLAEQGTPAPLSPAQAPIPANEMGSRVPRVVLRPGVGLAVVVEWATRGPCGCCAELS